VTAYSPPSFLYIYIVFAFNSTMGVLPILVDVNFESQSSYKCIFPSFLFADSRFTRRTLSASADQAYFLFGCHALLHFPVSCSFASASFSLGFCQARWATIASIWGDAGFAPASSWHISDPQSNRAANMAPCFQADST
jgi:hypothetical protein